MLLPLTMLLVSATAPELDLRPPRPKVPAALLPLTALSVNVKSPNVNIPPPPNVAILSVTDT